MKNTGSYSFFCKGEQMIESVIYLILIILYMLIGASNISDAIDSFERKNMVGSVGILCLRYG